MTNELLTTIVGAIVSHFSLMRYLSLGVQRASIHLDSGEAISLGARELRLGTDETYTVEAELSVREEGTQRIEAGWHIGEVRIIRRQDWLESGSGGHEIVGENPGILT